MKIFVGTSGWYYSWNKEKNLDWYVKHSSLNSVELNASFYRFPFPSYVKSWIQRGKTLKWSIKVNRLITHRYRFNEKSYDIWEKFRDLFNPMENLIDFYLFQLPPTFNTKYLKRLESFLCKTRLRKRFALEPRHISWFNKEHINWTNKQGITWVSVDSPNLPRDIFKTTDSIYIRMHGRNEWYRHNYTEAELKNVCLKIIEKKPKYVYIYFNNNHKMLTNAQMTKKILAFFP